MGERETMRNVQRFANIFTPARAMSRDIRIGIVSTAAIARKNLDAMTSAQNISATAISSRRVDSAAAWCDTVAGGSSLLKFGSHDKLLTSRAIDAIYTPLPTSLRHKIVTTAAKNKLGILCEKPIASAVKEAEAMIACCRSNDVAFMDGVMFMHSPRLPLIKNVISDIVRFGNIKTVAMNFSFCGDTNFHESDIRCDPSLEPLGALGDLGIYCVRFAMFVFDWRSPVSVWAHTHSNDSSNNADVIRSISCTLDFGGGQIAQFTSSFDEQLTQTATIVGQKGSVRIDDFVLPCSVSDPDACYFTHVYESGIDEKTRLVDVKEERIKCVSETPQEVLMWQKFVDLVRAGDSDERRFYEDVSLDTMKILERLNESRLNEGAKR